jgi:hypothetical protein
MEKQWRTAVKMAVNAALAADKRAIDKDWTHSYLSRNSPSMGRDFCIARYRVEKRCFFAIEDCRAGPGGSITRRPRIALPTAYPRSRRDERRFQYAVCAPMIARSACIGARRLKGLPR